MREIQILLLSFNRETTIHYKEEHVYYNSVNNII